MSENSNRKIKLANRSWLTIRSMLSGLAWARTPKDITVAGDMAKANKINLKESENDKVWDAEIKEIELYPREVDVCKKALSFGIKEGNVLASPYTAELVKVFIDE